MGLIQAFSRTNRVLNKTKAHGNIVCFRDLKDSTDNAILLYGDEHANSVVLVRPYNELVDMEGILFTIVPTPDSVDDLMGEEEKVEFINTFKEVMKLRNILSTFAENDNSNGMDIGLFEEFKSKYYDLYDRIKKDPEGNEKLVGIDFDLELIGRDEVDVDYILRLLGRLISKRKDKDYIDKKGELFKRLESGIKNS